MVDSKTYSFSTGWFGRAHEHGHSQKSTKVHCLRDGKPLCGYKPHKTMQFQWCAYGIMQSYIECTKCKQEASDYEYKDKVWVKKESTEEKDKALILECLRFTELYAKEDKKKAIHKLWVKLTSN